MSWLSNVTGIDSNIYNPSTGMYGGNSSTGGRSNPSIAETLGFLVGGPAGFKAGEGVDNLLSPPKAPQLQSPDALSTTPTTASTNTMAIQGQLANEQNSMLTSSYLSSVNAGVLDQPTSTSRVLLGS